MVEKFITRFMSAISGFAFLFCSLADLGMNILFYFFLGYDFATKLVLPFFGAVIVGAVIYGWATNKKTLAIFGAALSAFAFVSIMLADIEIQDQIATKRNEIAQVKAAEKSPIDQQIEEAIDNVQKAKTRRDATPPDQVTNWLRYDNALKEANKALSELRDQKTREDRERALKPAQNESSQEFKLELTAWSIFKQFATFKWSDLGHITALVFISALSIFIQIIIAYTVPRKTEQSVVEEREIKRRKKRDYSDKDVNIWVDLNWYRKEKGTDPNILKKEDFFVFANSRKIKFNLVWFDQLEKRAKDMGLIDASGQILSTKQEAKAKLIGGEE